MHWYSFPNCLYPPPGVLLPSQNPRAAREFPLSNKRGIFPARLVPIISPSAVAVAVGIVSSCKYVADF